MPVAAFGPPWIGPIRPRSQYERQWLWINIAATISAFAYFGWRALLTVAITTVICLATFACCVVIDRLLRSRWQTELFPHTLNMGMLIGLTLPLVNTLWIPTVAAILTGIACALVGPTHRVRVHPVALVQVLLALLAPQMAESAIQAVLAPNHVFTGSLQLPTTPISGLRWHQTHVQPPFDAIARPDPQRLMLQQQRDMLRHTAKIPAMLKDGNLPRMGDVLIGATPGPVGVTGQSLIILAGLMLIYFRVSRWPMALAGFLAAAAMLALLPLQDVGGTQISAAAFGVIGWRVSVTYIGYQLLASPLLLILLVMAPLTMPRTGVGRLLYGILLGAGIIAIRWFVPLDGVSYIPLIAAGLLCPILDRLRRSPFAGRVV